MKFIKAFIKKYSALILPAGLTLLAAVLFIPTLLVGGKVDAKMQQSLQQRRQIKNFLGQPPRKQQANLMLESQSRHEKQAKQVEEFALQTTKRELIKYGLFPKSEDSSSQVFTDFGNRLRTSIEDLITKRLRALDAPTAKEIQSKTGYMSPSGLGAGMGAGLPAYAAAPGGANNPSSNAMVNALCVARSEKIPVYAHPRVFTWYEYWGETYKFSGEKQALQDCWHSQVTYWIYEDVAATIESLNADSKKVSTSPVKRLLGIRFQGPVTVGAGNSVMSRGMGMYGGVGGPASSGGGVTDAPIYVSALSQGPFMANSWTGRVGNEELDVVHFAVSAILDSRNVLAFYKELCSGKGHQYREGFSENGKVHSARHNQITILESKVFAIQKDDAAHQFYRYGDGAVVQLDLICEYLFYRKAYDDIKPEPIKELLGQVEGAADPTAPMPFGMPAGL